MDSLLSAPAMSHFLIGLYFAFFGFWNIYHWSPIVEVMIERRIPMPWLMLAIGIAWQVVAGFLIILGVFVKITAISLIPYTIIAVFLFHPFWRHQGQVRLLNLTIFITNLTMVLGGLLLLISSVSPVTSI